MMKRVATAARWFAAAILILLGIAGSMLPFIPGFIFFGLAIALLATESHFIRKWLRWVRVRFPRLLRKMHVPRGARPKRSGGKDEPSPPSTG